MKAKWLIVILAVCLVVTVAAIAYAAGKTSAPQVIRAQRFELVDADGEVMAVLAVAPDMGAVLKLDGHSGRRTWLSGEHGVSLYDESGNWRAELWHWGLSVRQPISAWAAAEEALREPTGDALHQDTSERRGDQFAVFGFPLHRNRNGPGVALRDSGVGRGELLLGVDAAGAPFIEFVDATKDPPNVVTVFPGKQRGLALHETSPQQAEQE